MDIGSYKIMKTIWLTSASSTPVPLRGTHRQVPWLLGSSVDFGELASSVDPIINTNELIQLSVFLIARYLNIIMFQ